MSKTIPEFSLDFNIMKTVLELILISVLKTILEFNIDFNIKNNSLTQSQF